MTAEGHLDLPLALEQLLLEADFTISIVEADRSSLEKVITCR